MRRRSTDHLVPNEELTLLAALELYDKGVHALHGYLLAGQLRQIPSSRRAMAYSTVYRCLDRLEERGLVEAWNGPDTGPSGGPPRRHFALTQKGIDHARGLPPRKPVFDFSSKGDSGVPDLGR